MVFATHDLDEAAQADNLIVLHCECLCCAPPVKALADPKVTALFGPRPGSGPGRFGSEGVAIQPPDDQPPMDQPLPEAI